MSDRHNHEAEKGPDDNVVPIDWHRRDDQMPAIEMDEAVIAALVRRMPETPHIRTQAKRCSVDLCADDLHSIESEVHFGKRFGFVLGRRGRTAVIKVMDDYDFSSAEIKALYMVGSLRWDGETLRFKYVRSLRLLGAVQVVLLGLLLLAFLIGLALKPEAPWDARLTLLIVSSVLIFCIHWAHKTFILPFRGLRRQRKPGDAN